MTPILPPAEPPVEKMERLEFYVPGVPVPQGSKRHVGGGRMIEANKRLPKWRLDVKNVAREARAGRQFVGAVALLLDFDMPRPKSVKRLRPHVRPDLDKLVRAIGDALTLAGVWEDDGQVVVLHAQKRYAEQPGVRIVVRELA
jgi:crossover junction endodeoxyribonuclease RusA